MRLAAVLAAFGAVLAFAGQASADCKLNQVGELPVVMRGLSPLIPATVGGEEVFFLADSGATISIFSDAASERLGLKTFQVSGARIVGVGGEIEDLRALRLQNFTLGKFRTKEATFAVGPGRAFGDKVVGLIGQDFLGQFDVEYDLANGMIRLFKPEGCGKHPLAYWAPQYSIADISALNSTGGHLRGMVTVNDQKVRAILDTGASISILALAAAERAGVTPKAEGAVNDGRQGGLGEARFETWVVPVASFGLGEELIRNTRLRIGDLHINTPTEAKTGSHIQTRVVELPEMLLGADYFLSHRIYVANSQSRLYFTYNGGGVFARFAP